MKLLLLCFAVAFIYSLITRNDMTNCKACGKPISKTAHMCPHCGKLTGGNISFFIAFMVWGIIQMLKFIINIS